MASAIVSLDKETQFQKHQATWSLGHRQYLCWGASNISIGVHYPGCHDLSVCQKQAISSLQNGQSTWTTWESENNQPDSWRQQSTVDAHQAVLGSPLRLLWLQRSLSQHQVYSSGQMVYNESLETVTTLCVFSFLSSFKYSKSCVLSNLKSGGCIGKGEGL